MNANGQRFLDELISFADEAQEVAKLLIPDEIDDDFLAKELKRDTIAELEKEGGISTGKMFGAFIFNNAIKDAALKKVGDTSFSNTLVDYQRIITNLGFQKVLEIDFNGRNEYDKEDRPEKFFIYFEPKRGILLEFDTYNFDSVNGGKFYYNWRQKKGVEIPYGVTSSGGFQYVGEAAKNVPKCPPYDYSNEEERNAAWAKQDAAMKEFRDKYHDEIIWSGDHDCREALVYHIRQLDKYGDFVTPWRVQPWLWLLHHGDTKDSQTGRQLQSGQYDYKAINAERISMLPKEVQEAIRGDRKD